MSENNIKKQDETVGEAIVPTEPEENATPTEEQEVLEDTVILTEGMKAALSKTEEEEILDAKIQQGLNEAAETFKQEQELENVGLNIAAEIGKEYQKMERNMDEYGHREAAEIKTVYVKEKQRTGWWKIVMLVLAILITISFGLCTLFAGYGSYQLKQIAEHEPAPMPAPGTAPDMNGQNGATDNGRIGNFNLNDILEYFGYSPSGSNDQVPDYDNSYNNQNPGSYNNNEAVPDYNTDSGNEAGNGAGSDAGSNINIGGILDWIYGLFGENGSDGATIPGYDYSQGF